MRCGVVLKPWGEFLLFCSASTVPAASGALQPGRRSLTLRCRGPSAILLAVQVLWYVLRTKPVPNFATNLAKIVTFPALASRVGGVVPAVAPGNLGYDQCGLRYAYDTHAACVDGIAVPVHQAYQYWKL